MKRKTISKGVIFLLLIVYLADTKMPAAQGRITRSVKVGVVVDLEKWVGRMGLSCINMALSDFYETNAHYQTRLVINTRDSMSDIVDAAAAALDLIKNEQVQAIIGPTTSMQANFVIDLGEKAHVPVISYSATSPSLTSIRSPYFFRATQSDSTQVNAISAIIKFFRWRSVVPVYVDNEYGQGIIPYLSDALQGIDARIPYRSTISLFATDDQIMEELYKLMTMQTRVFIVHMSSAIGSRFFTKVREVGMMSEGYVWIITDGMTGLLSSLTPTVIDSMQGVVGVRPYIPRTKELENFRVRWKKKFLQDNPDEVDSELDIYGLWAHDAAIALAMAIEKAGTTDLSFQNANVTGNSTTDLSTLGMSRNGPNLMQALSNISFKGFIGDFHFINGQLPSPSFEIVNVIGKGARALGFWTPENGVVKNLNTGMNTTSSLYSISKSSLAHIIWPGDTTSIPKGWQIPTNGNKLRIGVPVKNGFSEFVQVTRDPDANTTTITGYCIDVFEAVVKALPYALTYQYIPFAMSNGSSAGTYDDLVYQVYLGNFDAAVGDTTIVFNRSLYVDFTLPYTESGVYLVVPTIDNNNKNAWVFVKPLTWDLWATSFCFFVFIGFVIWILEHRINKDFRGPPSHQFSTSLYFSFSTLFFAQRETVVSNYGRIVIIIWCFVVLILTQSYTASLTSLLTVQQLKPTFTDVKQLIKNGENVGYKRGSFVREILKNLGFNEANLIIYDSVEECHDLFYKGSRYGGIAAAFDEIPYVKLFLAKYCSDYSMVGPIFKTDGFGFVFPISSPLVPDVSRAILNVTEGNKMKEIEAAWFGIQNDNCKDFSTTFSSNQLSLRSFWGLFMIAGTISILSLTIYIAKFLYEHWPRARDSNSKCSMRSKIQYLLRTFDSKDLKSHTFSNGANLHNTAPMEMPRSSSFSISTTDLPEEQEKETTSGEQSDADSTLPEQKI